jgi:hypothetical protein
MALFDKFLRRDFTLHGLNFETIYNLILKSSEAKQIQQYIPIYLLNIEIFTKI